MSAPMKNRIDFLIERVEKQNPSANVKKIRAAYECAAQAHEGQKRRNGEPYIIHPVAVAEIIVEMGLDTDSICAGLLHDCIEDTEFGYREIENKFGTSVAELVDGVTRLGMLRYSKEQEQFEDLRKMFMAMAKDIRVILIKLPTACTMHALSSICPSASSATRRSRPWKSTRPSRTDWA